MISRTAILIAIFTLASQLTAQVFDLNREQAYFNIITGGTLNLLNSYYDDKHVNPLTPEEINTLSKQNIPSFDRWSVREYDRDMDDLGKYLTLISIGSAALFSAWDDPYTWDNLLVFSEILIVQNTLNSWTKSLALRNRPYTYDPDTEWELKTVQDARFSFYSRQTSTAFAVAVYSHFYQYHTTRNQLIVTGSYALATLVGISRINSGSHFPTDVITGMVAGSLSSYLICRSHLNKRRTRIIWGADSLQLNYDF